MQASTDGTVVSELERVYSAAAGAIAERGPACWASGRCCNFEKAGHHLYVTGLEAAYCVARAGPAPASAGLLPILTPTAGCPYQVRNLCSVHEIKPLGCRVYFCDRSAQRWQEELSERLLADIRAIHDRHGIAYRYGEWRAMLARFKDNSEQ